MTTTATPALQTGPTSSWPGLDTCPHGPRARVSAAVARRIFTAGASRLGITWSTDGSPADLVLHRPEEFFARLGTDGLIGFGESYLTGAWDADDLAGTLTVLCTEIAELVPAWMQRLRAAYVARTPRQHRGGAASSTRGRTAATTTTCPTTCSRPSSIRR
jgi:cyclopropane-fatty-acyl-phospholipid synthase